MRTTDSRHNRPVAPNLLKRNFSANAANEKWVGDIVGIWTDEGWLYLAALLDTYSRMIVGWAMSLYRDEALVEAALRMALARRDLPQATDLIQHTDRGSQYTADDYLALLKAHGIQVSMSGKGDPYDNAMMESFFSGIDRPGAFCHATGGANGCVRLHRSLLHSSAVTFVAGLP